MTTESLAWAVPVRIVQERKAQEFCDSWHLQKRCEVRGHAPQPGVPACLAQKKGANGMAAVKASPRTQTHNTLAAVCTHQRTQQRTPLQHARHWQGEGPPPIHETAS